jgi:hypothetical protein
MWQKTALSFAYMQSNDNQSQTNFDKSHDQSTTEQRVTVPEAARILGISPEAVRSRIQRGTLLKDKDADGTVYVRLNGIQSRSNHDRTTVKSIDESESVYVEELREQIAFLREVINTRDEELRREREARIEEKRRHDTIVLQLTQRIPELESSVEASDAPEASSDTPRSEEGTRQHRSWLYRFFFGP